MTVVFLLEPRAPDSKTIKNTKNLMTLGHKSLASDENNEHTRSTTTMWLSSSCAHFVHAMENIETWLRFLILLIPKKNGLTGFEGRDDRNVYPECCGQVALWMPDSFDGIGIEEHGEE